MTAFCLWLVSEFYSGFMIHGVFTTLVAALLVSIFSSFIHSLFFKATTR